MTGGSYACDTACSSSLVASHLGKVNLLEQRWDPLEWHLGLGTGLTLTIGSFIGGCAASEPEVFNPSTKSLGVSWCFHDSKYFNMFQLWHRVCDIQTEAHVVTWWSLLHLQCPVFSDTESAQWALTSRGYDGNQKIDLSTYSKLLEPNQEPGRLYLSYVLRPRPMDTIEEMVRQPLSLRDSAALEISFNRSCRGGRYEKDTLGHRVLRSH